MTGPALVDGFPAWGRLATTVTVVAFAAASPALADEPASGASARARSDSVHTRIDVGFRTDLSSEMYFEDSFDDTTFRDPLPRSTPEAVHLGVASLEWFRAATDRSRETRLSLEGGVGKRLRWGTLETRWVRPVGAPWRVAIAPRLQMRHDGTFDRDREELRSQLVLQARHRVPGSDRAVHVRAWGDVLRSSGAGSEFVLDRNVTGVGANYERFLGMSGDVQVGYSVDARAFPDSLRRDHLEHRFEISARRDWDSGTRWSGQFSGVRRSARRSVADSRDRFWSSTASAELQSPSWGLLTPAIRFELEDQRYDSPDSLLYFDHLRVRGALTVRLEPIPGWTMELGPGVEKMLTPASPEERYAEAWGGLDMQWLSSAALWSLTPSLGWREYDSGSVDGFPTPLSSFAYLDASVVLDHSLPGGLRARGFGYVRLERHAERSQDSRSLYFSLDVRRLF